MEHLKTSGKRLLLWTLLGLVLAGCAVLNVEVDVYKGPLANHRDIQLEQVAAMAVAARPLLLDLSYQLESKWRNENCGRVRYTVGNGKRKREYYRKIYSDNRNMSDGTLRVLCEQKFYRHHDVNSNKLFQYQFADPGVSHAFLNKNAALDFDPNRYIYGSSEARKVNALLELYRNQLPSDSILSQVVKKAGLIDEQIAIYRSSVPNQFWDDLLNESGSSRLFEKADEIFTDEAKEGLKTCPAPWRDPLIVKGENAKNAEGNGDIGYQSFSGLHTADKKVDIKYAQVFLPYKDNQLICGLRDYFSPAPNSGWRVSRRFQRLLYQTALLGASKKEQDKEDKKLVIPKTDAEYFLSTNGTYLWLSERENAEKIARSILNSECRVFAKVQSDCGREQLVDYITSLARSFINSRISLNQLYRFLLLNVEYYSAINDGESNRAQTDSLVQLVRSVVDYSDLLLAFNEIKKVCANENENDCVGLAAEYININEKNQAFELFRKKIKESSAGECAMDIPFVYKAWRSSDDLLSAKNKSKIFCGTSENESDAQKMLDVAFRMYPIDTAELLLALDSFLMEVKIGSERCYFINLENCERTGMASLFQKGSYEHRMGVVVGPNELLNEVRKNDSFANIAKVSLSTFSLGLKEGRRDRGLIDQIEYFLAQRDAVVSLSQPYEGKLYEDYPLEYKKTKALLLNSLEEFAQKLLVIANNSQLSGLDSLSEQTVSFQVVLQTVGNSILNYSNDITHQDSHEIRLAKRFDIERNAILHSVKLADPDTFSLDELSKKYEKFLDENLDKDKKKITSEIINADEAKAENDRLDERYKKIKVGVDSAQKNTTHTFHAFEKHIRKSYSNLGDEEAEKKGSKLLDKFMLQQFKLAAIDPLNVPDSGKDPRTIIDSLVLSLQYQYLMASLSDDRDRKALLGEAIQEAYEHRAGMIYIRPASAYLRSSYTASTLQPDGGTFDTNLLTDKWYKSIPFFGGLINEGVNDDEFKFNKVRNDLDKQNWQTVNNIRVKGAGKTNYVLVKDDVGNWYVKNYSDKKDKIIESARNLLLFSTSGLDIDGLPLPSNTKEEKGAETSEEGAAGDASKTLTAKAAPASTLERFFSRQQSSYYKTSIDHYNTVISWYATAIAQIVKQEIQKGCEGYEMDSGEDLEFKWLEVNKPKDDEYSYNNEVPLTSAQLKKVENIGDDIVDQVRDVVFSMPAELNKALKGNEHLCREREEKTERATGQEDSETIAQSAAPQADDLNDTNIQLARTQVYDSSIERIKNELVKPFMEKRQAFVEEQKSTNLMMQDMLTE